MSVFIVVCATLVIHSVVAKGPIVFMTLGQTKIGAFDGVYYPRTTYSPGSVNTYSETSHYINYKRVESLVNTTYNLSPRITFCGVKIDNDAQK